MHQKTQLDNLTGWLKIMLAGYVSRDKSAQAVIHNEMISQVDYQHKTWLGTPLEDLEYLGKYM